MSNLPTSVRVAQTVGLLGSLLLAGSSFGIVNYTMPAIRKSPTPLLLSQWKSVYRRGSQMAPPVAILTSAAFAYVAYHFRFTTDFKIWAMASTCAISIIPFTFTVVFPTNKYMERWHEKDGLGVQRDELDKKLTEWIQRHLARTCLTLAGGLLALFAVIRG